MGLMWPFLKCHGHTPWPKVRGGCWCRLGRVWILLFSRVCIVSHKGPGQVTRGLGGVFPILLVLHCEVAVAFALLSPNKMPVT